ncbi:hypothetical protein DEU56DRAFT_756349 [Suillus clintonianus]|uniref:uncharacterized protein n=1 Tax=Suillus clintonianus TaxID=1904413 RepID=UPI001B885F62|nr:uncharacterized protein DEU56DRAFT_756349 [Suillus clintonianus]KAG2136444.1 hypothetical protein DEU56DRAFT_756349 [Suillus clintonianus]
MSSENTEIDIFAPPPAEEQQQQAQEPDAEEVVEMSATKSIVVQQMKQSVIPVESDTAGSTTSIPKKAEPKVKKFTPRMSAQRPTNRVSCARCIARGHKCYKNPFGMVCLDCKQLKARCSLVAEKAKAKGTPTPAPAAPTVPKPSAAPTAPKPTAAPRPRPAPKSAHAAVAKDKGKGKANSKSTVSPTPQPMAGPSNTTGAYALLNSSRKRKLAEIEGEEDSESDQEDAYLAGRIQALPGLISIVETALGMLKKEVSEINAYMGRKRRRL